MYVEFQEWTGGRIPAVVGTNAGTSPLAFQNWRKFKEAFVPELIQRAVAETSKAMSRPVRACLDPFAGSGTTPLACQFLGVFPIAIEVNPFLADLVEAKLSPLDGLRVARRLSEVIATDQQPDPSEFYAEAPSTFVEPGKNGRYLFSRAVATRLAGLLLEIERVPEVDIRRFFTVLLASAALEACNALVSGKGRRYRRNWQSRTFTSIDVDLAFQRAVEAAIYDVTRYANRRSMDYRLFRGDAREVLAQTPMEVDLAVFSPPYPNSFDYTDVYNIELWILRYLRSKLDNRLLRKATLRSHVQIKRDFTADVRHASVASVVDQLRAAERLWNPHLPDMIAAYFADMEAVLSALRAKLPAGGRAYAVVGDSRYAGVDVPVAGTVTELAPALGFRTVTAEPFRSMRASPQQGGREELAETLLVLEAA